MEQRKTLVIVMTAAVALVALVGTANAEDKVLKVGIDLSLTGPDAESGKRTLDGALLAFDEINAKGGINGWKIQPVAFDDATPTAGQYDPAQAAINARKMVTDRQFVAAIGPQMSGAAKAMVPIFSQGGLATITPSATNPDLTDPQYARQYRPRGQTVLFRTVATDAYQGPYLANYYANVLHMKSVYVLDDGGAYGVGLADEFQRQAEKKGIKLSGRDRLDPRASDYNAVLTKIKAAGAESLYYGGVLQAGVKLAKQAYDVIPNVVKAGGDAIQGPEMLTSVGYPANEGWYATVASPHVTANAGMADWIKRYKTKFKIDPDDYAVTSYNAALVIANAVKVATATGKTPSRDDVREAIQNSKVQTLQGLIAFDANGDMTDKTISVFKITRNPALPAESLEQFKYVGNAPSN